LEDSSTDSSRIDGQGPILQAYPFRAIGNPFKKKKKLLLLWKILLLPKWYSCYLQLLLLLVLLLWQA
jgi:hypothetical protein